MPKADDEARREHRENRRTHRLNDNDLTPLKRARGYGDADKEEGEGMRLYWRSLSVYSQVLIVIATRLYAALLVVLDMFSQTSWRAGAAQE